MDDLSGVIWVILALGSGTLLIHAAVNAPVHARAMTIGSIIALVITTIASIDRGESTPAGVIALLCATALLIHAWRKRNEPDPIGSGRTMLVGVITAGIGVGALVTSPSPNRGKDSDGNPIVVFDMDSRRAELLAIIDAATADLDLILERDLPTREQQARESGDWERLETLSRIRERLSRERTGLADLSRKIVVPGETMPTADSIRSRLDGIERLVGAVRLRD
ncbi:MAG: hypothetical protein MK082_03575 [Phycisphaerales bacterium]|nr:hypothetical protein [Phycisphaerales bacterium]